ncbi:skin secretory protein xP2-like [Corvus moneduloides]|uniref:skin secretory protein xP2-like n=1 Tax=Corvus moneduloides TaxID=1196302 RepID=UPI001362ACAE|nr:skin secretory protein xP2-like [Corvus moneduloides]
MSNEGPQTCPPVGPSSPSPVGTEVEAEAAPALRSASPAPGTAMEAEPAAAAPSGDAEEEEPPKPLVPDEEKAAAPSVTSEELPSIGTRSPPSVPFNTPASSQASLYLEQNITGEMLSQALLEMLQLRQQREEEYALQQWMALETAQPRSPSPVGTEVEAEAAPALRSASPAPGTAMETEPAAAAPSGDDEKEKPPKPLVPEEETAAAPPVTSEELPSIGTRSPPCVPFNTPASSQASGYQEPNITGEMLSQALLEMLELRQQYEKEYAIQQWMAVVAAATAQREESSVPAPHSPPSPSPAQLGAQALREQQEEAAAGSVVPVQGRMEDSDEEMKFWQLLDDLEPFLVRDPEQSQESLPGQSIPLGEGIPELVQESWEDETDHGIWNKPLHSEDEWDEVSVLELPAEDKEQKRRAFAADGLPVPVPREAWVEGPAPEPCSPGPLCASPTALQGRAPVGHAASPAFEEPVLEAGTESPVPAPRKRPSHFRPALRGLFRCPCLAPQPED